jgi:hypothetical protein
VGLVSGLTCKAGALLLDSQLWFHSVYEYTVFPASFIEETIFLPMYILGAFVKN